MFVKCILCFKEIAKDYERFLVKSKKKTIFDVNIALANLDFLVYTVSEYICRQCHGLLKKRQNLQQNLEDLEKSLKTNYAASLEKAGLVFQPKELQKGSNSTYTPKRPRLEDDSRSPPLNEHVQSVHTVQPVHVPVAFPSPLMSSTPKKRVDSDVSDKPSSTSVKVRIEWPSTRMDRKVPEQLESLGKMLIRGTYRQIANAAWRSPNLKKELQLLVLKDIDRECTAMCSKKEPSCVRSPDKKKLLNFSFEKFNHELSSKAPLLHAVLRVSCVNRRNDSVWQHAVGMAAAICLRNRSQYMNGVQLLLSIFGYHSNWMATMQRLSPLRLMTSHTHLYAKLDEFGKDFDAAIKKRVSVECQYLNVHHQPTTSLPHVNVHTATGTSSGEIVAQSPPTTDISSGEFVADLHPATCTSSGEAAADLHPTNCTSSGQISVHPTSEQPATAALPESGNIQVVLQPDIGRKITFDNFDIHQEVHHMTEQNQNKDKHYVTVMSTENRVSGAHLRRDGPVGDIETLENGKCVPNKIEHQKQKENYVVLVSRIIVANIQCLKHLEEVVIKHIPHRYQKETSKATDTTFLGVLYHNENSSDGILEILKELHKYVPYSGDDEKRTYADQGVVGDQLTVERAVNGHATVCNGFTPEERLEGLHFQIADWHAGNKFLQVGFDRLYSPASSQDKCTLYSDRNLINRRNVKAKVDSAVKPAHSFFDLCLKARVVAAALEIMKLKSVDDPCADVPKADAFKASKKKYLDELAGQIVNDFILSTAQNKELANSLVGEQRQSQSAEDSSECDDDMLSYQKALMEYGLLLLNFKDAVSDGDGDRNLRCWKFFLLHLRNDKRSSKYALEALYMMFQVYALLSPKAAHELIWNRLAKSRNCLGGNIPLDLLLEFFNRLLKDAVKKLGPNASQKSIDRICKSITITNELMDIFDKELQIQRRSGRHVAKSSDEDLKKVVKDLVDNKAMRHTPGRVYRHYRGMKSSFLWNFDISDMHNFINDHKKYIETKRRAR